MKEDTLVTIMELTEGMIGAHDDMLLVRGNKVVPGTKVSPHPEGLGVGLTKGYWEATEIKRRNGERVITNYYKGPFGPTRVYLSAEKVSELDKEEREKWKPVFARGRHLAEGIDLTIQGNDVDLIMSDLYVDFGRRYRHALDCMLDMETAGILKYEPRVEPTEKNRQEAIRNRLKEYMKPTKYEHNLIFRGAIGRAMYAELNEHNRIESGYGTIYLQGAIRHKGQTELAVKFYDIGHRARERDGEADAKDGEIFKLETTFLRPYFHREKMGIEDLGKQTEIQAKLAEDLVDSCSRVLGYLSGGTLDMIAEALQTDITNRREAPRMLARAMLNYELTLAGRVETLERDMAQVKRDVAQLKRAAGLK